MTLAIISAFKAELAKLAEAPAGAFSSKPVGKTQKFMSGAGEELGPALGATLGAGIAKAQGYSPVAGSALGYGLGSIPNLAMTALRKKASASLPLILGSLAKHAGYSDDWQLSEYSGPTSYGRFKQESYIPPFNNPPVKTAGPPTKTKKAAALKLPGMVSAGTQTMGPQLKFSPTKQLTAAKNVAKLQGPT